MGRLNNTESNGEDKQGILDRLDAGEILLLDGATGTYLQDRGLEPGGSPELMNAESPEIIRQMAEEYFEAGADMVLTNSFGGSKFMLKKYGVGDRVQELNRLAAEHASSAAPEGKYVVGSVGPTGEFMEPLGEVSEQEMYDAFATQIASLAEGGADAVVVETQMAIEEAVTAVRAARENTDLVVMSTMVFDKGPRGYFTMMGVTPERAVEELREAGAHVVGTNCGSGIEKMIELGTMMRAVTDDYLIIQSNAGIPSIVKGEICYPESPEFMAENYTKLAEIPINVLGGCCGTGPEHIELLVKTVRDEEETSDG